MSDFERSRQLSAGAAVHAGGGGAGGGASGFDEMDPHGGTPHAHGHVIVSAIKMRIVLITLLTFTVLTVAAARTEIWVTGEFGIEIPHWVNILVALSIATVKSTLVVLYFMQLRYDNPINAIILVLCIGGLGIFLFFSMADLGSRGWIYPDKFGEISKGGHSFGQGKIAGGGSITGPIADFEKQKYIEKVGMEQYERELAEHHAHEHGAHAAAGSTAQRSRPRTGLTPDLFSAKAEASHEGGHEGEAPAGEHKSEPAGEKKTGEQKTGH
jgi:cytochrome c oxidase subunit 4